MNKIYNCIYYIKTKLAAFVDQLILWFSERTHDKMLSRGLIEALNKHIFIKKIPDLEQQSHFVL